MDKRTQIEEMALDIIKESSLPIEISGALAIGLYNAGYRKVVMCKDCAYCDEHYYEEEGEKPYIKLTCKWSNYAHHPKDFCNMAKMKGE